MFRGNSSRSLLPVVPKHSVKRSHTAYTHCHEIYETEKLISNTCTILECDWVLKNCDFYTKIHFIEVLSYGKTA
jgi:hypothetical protein